MKKRLEINTYTYDGVEVTVKIDYIEKKITLVEFDGQKFVPKQWLFRNRGLDYIDRWCDILGAMTYAIGEAKKLLSKG